MPCIQPSPVHVAFYLPALPAGGLERVTLTLCQELAARGHSVDLVLERGFGEYLQQIPAGVRRIVLAKHRKREAYSALTRRWPSEGLRLWAPVLLRRGEVVPLRRLPSLIAYFEDYRPQVVIAAAGDIPFLALWAAKTAQYRPRILIAEHGTLSARLAHAPADSPEARGHRRRIKTAARLYSSADKIIAVSHGVADDLVKTLDLAPEHVRVQYNPVAIRASTITAPEHGRRVHPWLGRAGVKTIMGAGRLADEKDFATLIRAFAIVAQQCPGARLIILGQGPKRSALLELVSRLGLEQLVDLPGWQNNLRGWLDHAEVFVLSSRHEGFGLVLVEALAAGCPVISTDCKSGPAEILDQGRFGRLVPVGDSTAMAKAITHTLAEPPDRRRLQQRASDFSIDKAVDGYEQLLQKFAHTSG